MNYQIENQHLKATIKSSGAELCSLVSKSNLQEYIWEAKEDVWSRHAPVLFPIVGKLKNNQYSYQGKTYELPQHGFARDKEFTCIHQAKDKLTFQLKADEETLSKYPFHFELHIIYQLKFQTLQVKYEVYNQGDEQMYFSIGAHPGFKCPLKEGESFKDYHLSFEHDEPLQRLLLSNGLFKGEKENIPVKEGLLPLSKELFAKDALVFQNLKSTFVHLKNKSEDTCLAFDFPQFPYLGIWSKGEEPEFICLEPWFGLADYTDHNNKLEEKKGIQKLEPKQMFECAYAITIEK